MTEPKPLVMPEEFPEKLRDSLVLIGGAVLVGVLTGLVGVAFLRLLELGNDWRIELTAALRDWPAGTGLPVLILGTGACAAIAAWLVKRFSPNAVGSGIPYVEKILCGPGEPNHAWVLPVLRDGAGRAGRFLQPASSGFGLATESSSENFLPDPGIWDWRGLGRLVSA